MRSPRRWFCPGAVFGYVDALQCRQGFGTYCPEGSSTNLSGCPGGFYCPTPAQKLVCPANHFCREFSTAPRKCPLSSRCPEGASLPKTSFVGLAVAVVAMVTVGAVTQGVMWRHAVKAHRNRHKLQRAVQTSDNCSTFVMDMLGDAGNALLGEVSMHARGVCLHPRHCGRDKVTNCSLGPSLAGSTSVAARGSILQNDVVRGIVFCKSRPTGSACVASDTDGLKGDWGKDER